MSYQSQTNNGGKKGMCWLFDVIIDDIRRKLLQNLWYGIGVHRKCLDMIPTSR
jgi:hypothetical protein